VPRALNLSGSAQAGPARRDANARRGRSSFTPRRTHCLSSRGIGTCTGALRAGRPGGSCWRSAAPIQRRGAHRRVRGRARRVEARHRGRRQRPGCSRSMPGRRCRTGRTCCGHRRPARRDDDRRVLTAWRTLDQDAQSDAAWQGVYRRSDVISPWTVGRGRAAPTSRPSTRPACRETCRRSPRRASAICRSCSPASRGPT
jgi:hypothetical protein